jgi:hypothetical protein
MCCCAHKLSRSQALSLSRAVCNPHHVVSTFACIDQDWCIFACALFDSFSLFSSAIINQRVNKILSFLPTPTCARSATSSPTTLSLLWTEIDCHSSSMYQLLLAIRKVCLAHQSLIGKSLVLLVSIAQCAQRCCYVRCILASELCSGPHRQSN